MADAATCPVCASRLRRVDIPDRATVARYVGVELLFWAALALAFAALGASGGARELYAALAVLAFVAWLRLRPGQVTARRAFTERARYHCEHCNRTFRGPGPWPSA